MLVQHMLNDKAYMMGLPSREREAAHCSIVPRGMTSRASMTQLLGGIWPTAKGCNACCPAASRERHGVIQNSGPGEGTAGIRDFRCCFLQGWLPCTLCRPGDCSSLQAAAHVAGTTPESSVQISGFSWCFASSVYSFVHVQPMLLLSIGC